MTLTTVVGSSGSGKTTFLNDVHKSHKCTYIRQYHNLRPYITVSKIPNFDPISLPFWEIYENEGKADTIQVGGTMAGEFTPGLSGGQRKLLLFELIYQRTKNQKKLLLVFDEPFAGVTDDFVPWIVDRLNLMRQKHNILLVTNDHVQALSEMADNVLTVSAIDRTKVKINDREQVDREKAILALSVGNDYHFGATNSDFKFFLEVEVWNSGALKGIFAFTMFTFLLFLLTFWDSQTGSAALVLIGAGIIAYFAVNPYLLSLVDWRNYMAEESEALLHSSKGMNKLLKTLLTMSLVFIISLLEYGFVNAVVSGLEGFEYWVAMFFDSASMTFPFMCFGLYTDLPFQAAQILGSMPFLFMIFFSTTFSPSSGVPVLKELRYLFSRFYFWCMVPVVDEQMEGCPADRGLNVLYLCLSGLLGVFLFIVIMGGVSIVRSARKKKDSKKREAMMDDDEFQELQLEMYGEQQLRKLLRADSSGSLKSVTNTVHSDFANNMYSDIEV
jgi:ABC-type lipoprotein export system ATPase subunit